MIAVLYLNPSLSSDDHVIGWWREAVGLVSFILAHQLEGISKEPVTLFEKSSGRSPGVMVYLTCAVIRLCGFRWRKKYKENLEITCNHYGSCCNWNLNLRNVFVPLNFFKACIGESVNLKLWQVKDVIETITKIGLLWFAIIFPGGGLPYETDGDARRLA